MNELFTNKGDKATKLGFGEGLLAAGKQNPKVVAIGADISVSVGVNLFVEVFPERFISLGIAEQNCTGVAAGLALAGKIPVFSTYGVFSTLRNADQIRVSLCYNNLHVIIGGAHSGVSVGPDGATHQALEDIAVMRVMPNMTILSPCDATQTRLMTMAAIEQVKGPVYIRFGREPMPDFTNENETIEIGKAQIFREGSDLSIISTGHMTWEALQAADMLDRLGIQSRVINMHTIKPIDKETIISAAKDTGLILTIEEHQIAGGLGSAVAEVVSGSYPVRIEMLGMKDRFGESGKPRELMEKYGLCSGSIKQIALNLLQKKSGKKS